MTDEVIDAEVIEGEQVESPDVETEVVDTETETLEPSESSTEKPESDKIQERIDKATKKQRVAERDAEFWRNQAMKAEKPEPVVEQPAPLEVKTLEDFEYDETKYQAYIFETAQARAVEAAKYALQEDRSVAESQTRQREFQSKEKEYAKEMTDYMEVTRDESLSLTKDMVDIASSSDNGPAILYHLAKNPDLSASLAALPPLVAAREIGKIEIKLSKEPKSSSNAPPPPPKIKGGDPAVKKDFLNDPKTTQKQWNEHRRKVIANRGN